MSFTLLRLNLAQHVLLAVLLVIVNNAPLFLMPLSRDYYLITMLTNTDTGDDLSQNFS